MLVLRRSEGLRQQRQDEHQQSHRPNQKTYGQQHRPHHLCEDHRPGRAEIADVAAREHPRCEECLRQRKADQQVDNWRRHPQHRAADVEQRRQPRPQSVAAKECYRVRHLAAFALSGQFSIASPRFAQLGRALQFRPARPAPLMSQTARARRLGPT